MNYFNNGFHFFQPQIFNLASIDGKAACEFPFLYFQTAILYKLFGEHEFILRLITITIASTGFYCLFKLLLLILEDSLYALFFTFLFLSSTVLLYYTNNFLPDASAFGFCLIGWYFFYQFYLDGNKKNAAWLSMVFFMLSALLKVTYFINPIAALASILTVGFLKERLGLIEVLRRNIVLISWFSIAVVLVIIWNWYALTYNATYHDNYFRTQTNPIWILDKKGISNVWGAISKYWFNKYYYNSTFHVFTALIILGIFLIKKADTKLLAVAIFTTLGSLAYFLLFYAQFGDHDYYFITLLPGLIFLVISSFVTLRNKFPTALNSFFSKLALLVLCVLSLNYGRKKLAERYSKPETLYSQIGTQLAGTRSVIDSLGISANAKIVILADKTPCGGLYFLNRQGWNIADTTDFSKNKLASCLENGADYAVITDRKYVSFLHKGVQISEKDGIIIYKLKP